MIVGYGFADEHINCAIADAVERRGLSVFIWNTTSDLKGLVLASPHGASIWKGLISTATRPLIEVFPSNQAETEEYRRIYSTFLFVIGKPSYIDVNPMRSWLTFRLAVEPDIFHAPAVVLAVYHDGQPLDLRLHAGRGAGVVDDRARPVLLQLLVDVPDEMPALFSIGGL